MVIVSWPEQVPSFVQSQVSVYVFSSLFNPISTQILSRGLIDVMLLIRSCPTCCGTKASIFQCEDLVIATSLALSTLMSDEFLSVFSQIRPGFSIPKCTFNAF
jgi:hypothetical protein